MVTIWVDRVLMSASTIHDIPNYLVRERVPNLKKKTLRSLSSKYVKHAMKLPGAYYVNLYVPVDGVLLLIHKDSCFGRATLHTDGSRLNKIRRMIDDNPDIQSCNFRL